MLRARESNDRPYCVIDFLGVRGIQVIELGLVNVESSRKLGIF